MRFARGPQKKPRNGPFGQAARHLRGTTRLGSLPGGEALEPRTLLAADLSNDWYAEPSSLFSGTAYTQQEAIPMVGSATANGFTPAQLRHAYGFDQITFEGGTIVGDGTGQTIAIVNAYHTPNAAADLAAFSAYFGLPMAPSFVQISQYGDTNFPTSSGSWALETALDVQWAHAMAPGANILLVEADSAGFGDLATAVDVARNYAGVSVVSMSWGGLEWSSETSFDNYYRTPDGHSNVAFLAAAGNAGSPGVYPAYSPNVVAVGGTTLTLNGSNNISSETAWSGGGGGLSQYIAQPLWQSGVVTQSATMRGSPDVSYLANPSTGVPVYDTFNNLPAAPWTKAGGTSFATPSWAALVAIADQGRSLAGLPTLDVPGLMTRLYAMPATNFNDITSGSSGGTTPQAAVAGYDLVTGRGSPKANLIVPALLDSGTIIGNSSVAGTVFSDVNGNGTLDAEAGLANWRVYADLNNNGVFDPIATSTSYSNDPQLAIPSNSTVTSSNVVSGLSGDILDVNVTVSITHTRDADLVLTLIAPDGTRYLLASGVGGSGDNFSGTVFDDSAPYSIVAGAAPFTRTSFRPMNALTGLFGKPPNGTWQLEVVDNVAGNVGTLEGWSLDFTTGDPNTRSAANGAYLLGGLPAGSYQIREVVQPSYTQTSPGGGFYPINLTTGQSVVAQNFGNQLQPSTAPTTVTLVAASDTGVSNSDRITKLNNGSVGTKLQFQVTGTIVGATVTIYADGVAIGSAVASGTTTTVTTNGTTLLADGNRTITARQTESGRPESTNSPGVIVLIDTAAPVATIVPVSPDPRTTPVGQVSIQFNEVVSGLTLGALSLARNGGANLISGSQTVTTVTGSTWTLNNLSTITTPVGNYDLLLTSSLSPATDLAGNVATNASENFTVSPTVLGRKLFYNQSKFDGSTSGVSTSDDLAIATDKIALLPGGGQATFSNVSSYTRGINGIMVDIAGSHPAITAADFTFRIGANNTPSQWLAAQTPESVVVRAGAGVNGSDRVEIIWASGTIVNTWLEVTVAANANTGLLASDIFYFGNRVGDDGSGSSSFFLTTFIDEQAARSNSGANAAITNLYDFDRTGVVNVTDSLAARFNAGSLQKINIGSPPAAPQASPFVASPYTEFVGPVFLPLVASEGDATDIGGRPSINNSAIAFGLVSQANALTAEVDDLDEQLIDLLGRARARFTRR